MNELIQYVEKTEAHAKFLVTEYKRLRNEQEFNMMLEAPLFAALASWYKAHQEIEQKRQSIILEYEAQNIPCESLIKHLQTLHDFIYHELIEWELKKLNDKINMKFVRFTFESRKQLKYFIDNLKKLDFKQKDANLHGFDNLNEVISYFKTYTQNVEGIVKYYLPDNIEHAKKRLKTLSNDELTEVISIKCHWAQKEIEKQLLKGGEGVQLLIKKAIDELDNIYLEFERLAKQYKLNDASLFHDMLPFNRERNFNFAPFFCWVKSIQTHSSKVPKTVCANLNDNEPTEAKPQKDFPLIFHELEVFELFEYLVEHYDNDKDVSKYSHLYHFINEILGGWKAFKQIDYKNFVEKNHNVEMSKILPINNTYTDNYKRQLTALKMRFNSINKKE